MEQGYTTLTPSNGYPELRKAITDFLNEEYGVFIDPDDEILVVPGAKFGVFAAMAAVCDPGDEVLCPTPFFPPHREAVEMVGGKFVSIPIINNQREVELKIADLESKLTDNTRAILISYPHNPTGWVPSSQELDSIIRFAADHQLLVISDEAYDQLNFDGIKHTPVFSFDSIKDHFIYVNTFSKSFAMTGWRLGYCVAKKDFVKGMVKIQQNVTTCASSIAQRAGLGGILKAGYFPRQLAGIYEERRDLLMDELGKIPGIHPIRPKGSFFVFIDISQLGISSVKFADQILENSHIALAPGSAFGDEWDHFIRISMTVDKNEMFTAMKRLRDFTAKF
jgi:aspartate/methionine/tyrosine aminotransferase